VVSRQLTTDNLVTGAAYIGSEGARHGIVVSALEKLFLPGKQKAPSVLGGAFRSFVSGRALLYPPPKWLYALDNNNRGDKNEAKDELCACFHHSFSSDVSPAFVTNFAKYTCR